MYQSSLFEMAFSIIPIMIALIFLLVFFVFLLAGIKGLSEWSKNNRSPKIIVDAVVMGKREDISHRGGGHRHYSHTTYYIAYELESGDRIEFRVDGSEYGIQREGDKGKLTFQGTRYLGFERQ